MRDFSRMEDVNLEKQLMDALKYGGGVSEEHLAELVKLGSKLMQQMGQGGGKAERALGGLWVIPWWWKYGTPDPRGIAFESILDQKGLQNLVDVVSKNRDIANSLQLELTPSVPSQGSEQGAWRVVGKLGAKVTP